MLEGVMSPVERMNYRMPPFAWLGARVGIRVHGEYIRRGGWSRDGLLEGNLEFTLSAHVRTRQR